MGLHGTKPFRLSLLTFLVISGVQCARETSNSNQGTQDSGGGVVFNSSTEQVNEALDLALKLATEPDMTKNVFVQFWKDWGQKSKNEQINRPVHLFSRAETAAKSGGEVSPNEHFESPFLMALKTNKIVRVNSDCRPSSGANHTDASVSSFSADAEICFSVRNLMRIPPSGLLREILSLVLHEATHMGGAQEPEAVAWQELFSSYFGARFGDLSADTLAAKTLKTLGVARIILAQARELAVANPRDPRLFAQMGKFVQTLDSLPELRDPLAFELKLKPKHPKSIATYSSSVLGLIENIRLSFEINTDSVRAGGLRIPLNFMPPERVLPTLNAASVRFEQINENFLIIAGRTDFSKSVCTTLPGGAMIPFAGMNDPSEFPPACE